MNQKTINMPAIVNFFQEYNINVKRPAFVISQGMVTALAELTPFAIT